MILRRVAAVVSALVLLRVNYVAVDLACAQHNAAGATAADQAGGHDHHTSVLVDAVPRADASETCAVPVQSECCRALASCSVALGFSTVSHAEASLDMPTILALGMHTPASRSDAPDPPPPKS